jgi:hypothetical protein
MRPIIFIGHSFGGLVIKEVGLSLRPVQIGRSDDVIGTCFCDEEGYWDRRTRHSTVYQRLSLSGHSSQGLRLRGTGPTLHKGVYVVWSK